MQESTNSFRIHRLGGFGGNVGEDIYNGVNIQGGARAKHFTIETSNDLRLKELHGELIKIDGLTSGEEVDGSGSVRGENSEHIKVGIKQYTKGLKPNPKIIDIVIYAGSSGSGGVMAAFLIDHLVRNDHNLLVIMVNDLKNEKYLENSRLATATLDRISKKYKKNIILSLWYNNEGPKVMVEQQVNNNIVASLAYLSIIYSGLNTDMDTADVGFCFNLGKLKNNKIPTGLIRLRWETNGVNNGYFLTRTIISKKFDGKAMLGTTITDKVGKVGKEIEPFFDELVPSGDLSLCLEHNVLVGMVEKLDEQKRIFDEVKYISDDITFDDLEDEDLV